MDTQDRSSRSQKQAPRTQKKKRSLIDWKWTLSVFLLSLVISVFLAFFSNSYENPSLLFGFIALVCVILLGVIFDYIGIAVASADAAQFHSMASRGNPIGAKGVWLVKNANKVSSFCNDVIGDISGILSGALGASLSLLLFLGNDPWGFWGDLLLTGAISAITVGGKALLKGIAMANSQQIVSFICRVLCFFSFGGEKKNRGGKRE